MHKELLPFAHTQPVSMIVLLLRVSDCTFENRRSPTTLEANTLLLLIGIDDAGRKQRRYARR